MFKKLCSINQSGRCTSLSLDKKFDEYVAFSEDNLLKIYNKYDLMTQLNNAEPINVINSESDIVHVRMNSQGDKLAFSNMDYKICVYDISYNYFSKTYEVDEGALTTFKFEFHPTRNEFVTGCYSIAVHDIDSAEKILDLNNEYKYIYSYAYLDYKSIAVGNASGSINILSLETQKLTNKIEEHCMPVRALTLDPYNKKLISASDDLHINIFDTASFKVTLSLVGHKEIITGVAVDNTNNIYASCSHDGTVKIWDLKSSKAIQTINLESEGGNHLWDLSFSADGKSLFCGSDSGLHILALS